MTALQAIQQAQQTGQIALSKPTANILQALAEFDQSSEKLCTAIADNLPCEMSDNETVDKIIGGYLNVIDPVQTYLYKEVGDIMFKGVFLYTMINKFEGL